MPTQFAQNSIGVRGGAGGGSCARGPLERVGKTTRVYIHMHKFHAQLNCDVCASVCVWDVCVNARGHRVRLMLDAQARARAALRSSLATEICTKKRCKTNHIWSVESPGLREQGCAETVK